MSETSIWIRHGMFLPCVGAQHGPDVPDPESFTATPQLRQILALQDHPTLLEAERMGFMRIHSGFSMHLMGFNRIYGDEIGVQWIFHGDLQGFHGDLMGFNGYLM